MNRRILGFIFSVLIFVSSASCTPALLEREYSLETAHAEQAGLGTDPSVLRADSYDSLVTAILQLVSQGITHGIIRLYNYPGDVKEDLAAACLEVQQEDPLGAYCVDYMTHEYSRIISYYEAHIYITYRRSYEEIKSIVSATGSSAIKSVLQDALLSFAPAAAVRISYLTEDEAFVQSLVEDAYYASPGAAFGLPECTVNFYPDSGEQRIIEVRLAYQEPQDTLLQWQAQVMQVATDLVSPVVSEDMTDTQTVNQFYRTLRDRVEYANGDGRQNTIYDALVLQRADSEGLALAFSLLCETAQMECHVVRGEKDGHAWFWNIVKIDGIYRHLDLGSLILEQAATPAMRTDGQMSAYIWDQDQYPACTETS